MIGNRQKDAGQKMPKMPDRKMPDRRNNPPNERKQRRKWGLFRLSHIIHIVDYFSEVGLGGTQLPVCPRHTHIPGNY
jgi:hypothetical protein